MINLASHPKDINNLPQQSTSKRLFAAPSICTKTRAPSFSLAILIELLILPSHPKGTNNLPATKHQQAIFYYPISLHQNMPPSFSLAILIELSILPSYPKGISNLPQQSTIDLPVTRQFIMIHGNHWC
ncbi:hypothetical protein [Bartonella sp. LB28NMGDW]|uniref:hypothetical protein n=1 Tax=Bartonella sp. LB28NMGDW TaxID=3243549 RepID=UPI0035CEDDBA